MRNVLMAVVWSLCLLAQPGWAAKGIVEITSEPGGAKLFINGVRKGNTPTQPDKVIILELDEGDYLAEVVSDGPPLRKGKAQIYVATGVTQPVHIVAQSENKEPEFVRVPKGCFQMGSAKGEKERNETEGPQHRVCFETDFYLGRTEVTQAQWVAIMGNNPSRFKGVDLPVENVSWDDIQLFLTQLNARSGSGGRVYRLPSEAEWEYAARASTTTPYVWGHQVGKNNANCDGCGSPWDSKETAPVASFAANTFGLHDMYGNVWEWLADCWHEDYNNAPTNGTAWTTACSDPRRVLRGGAWFSAARNLRAADRHHDATDDRYPHVGFRLAYSIAP